MALTKCVLTNVELDILIGAMEVELECAQDTLQQGDCDEEYVASLQPIIDKLHNMKE